MDLILDIGGSSVKSAVVDSYDDDALTRLTVHTEKLGGRSFSDVAEAVHESIRHWKLRSRDLSRLGICTTGSVSDGRIVTKAGHFEGYENIVWEDLLSKAGSTFEKVVVSNDGRASAWAEYSAQPKEVRNHIHLVIGTGLGGSAVVNKKLVEGDHGIAGYWGHIVVTDQETVKCSCKRMGCAETLCSVPGMLFQYNILSKSKIYDFGEFLSAYEANDSHAIDAVDKAGFALGTIIAVGANILDPHKVTIGGGVIQALERIAREKGKENRLIRTARETATKNAHWRFNEVLALELAKYGNDGGLIGVGMMLDQA